MTTPTNFPVGAKVRSFDFPGRNDCYIDGTVLAIEHGCYLIKVESVMLDGEERVRDAASFGTTVHAPLNGIPCIFGGVTSGVVGFVNV